MSQSNFSGDGLGPQVRGVATGVVTNVEDPEDMGRVKVKYPWRETEDESYWARIATTAAGGDRGTYFLPDVDDEVLLAFEGGDIDRPYVVGSVWNGKDKPPLSNADGKEISQIKTSSGHVIELDDTGGSEKVSITTSKGHEIVLDDGGDKVEVTDKAGDKIELDSGGGEISIDANQKLSLSAGSIELKAKTGDVKIEGTTGVDVTSSTGMKLKSNTTMEVEGTNVNVKGNAMVAIKGALIQLN